MLPERQNTADRLHSAALHLVRAVRAVDTEMGLTPTRASALSILVFAGPRTVGELAAAEQVRSPTMSALVDRLEEEGLARRMPSANDGRKVIVEPTPEGRRILEEGRARRVQVLDHALSTLDDDALAVLQQAPHPMETAARAIIAATSESPDS